MKLTELPSKPPNVLIYGEVGTGKTAFLETLGERVEILDCDDGLRSGLKIDDKWKPERLKIEAKQFLEPTPGSRAVAFSQIKKYVYALEPEIVAKRFKPQILALDSLTTFADAALNYIMYNSNKLGQAPEIQHWGLAFNEIKNVLGVMKSLPIPVVLIAHEQVKTVGKGTDKEDRFEIAIQGKNLPSQITRYFDEIWYFKAKPDGGGKFKRVLQTVSDNLKVARSRACLPNEVDTSVGMVEIFKMIGYPLPELAK